MADVGGFVLCRFKFYVLPDGYQVSDPSLQDIISVLNPRYNPAQLPALSLLPSKPSYTLNAQPYFPGYIGLNNIRANDYSNVIVHLLLHIPPVRDYFLSPTTPQLQIEARPTELIKRFSALAKRVWNPRLFKAQVSPHEFLQEVTKRSEGKFGMIEQGDPVAFLGWLLNTLHRDLGGSKKSNSSESRGRLLEGVRGIKKLTSLSLSDTPKVSSTRHSKGKSGFKPKKSSSTNELPDPSLISVGISRRSNRPSCSWHWIFHQHRSFRI